MPKTRLATVRQEIIDFLTGQTVTARDISQAIGIAEKEVYDHLSSVKKTLKHQHLKLYIEPYRCMKCDYVFRERKKLTKPGKCPSCKGERIEPAMFKIDA